MISRRRMIGALGCLAAIGCTSNLGRNLNGTQQQETFVLVHGAWHGGWCWQYVASQLRSAGHRVFTPTLTGLGDRRHLHSRDINLSTHSQDIITLIESEQLENVTLVGHSYAGYIVTLVADRVKNRLKHVVYLDASLPTEGKSFFPQGQQAGLLEKYGEAYSLPPGSLEFLGIPKDHPRAEWVLQHLTPHPLGTFLEPVTFNNGGAEGLSKTFIRCTGNPRHKSGDPVIDAIKDNPEWTYRLIDTGHDAMVTEPELLATMLMNEAVTR